MTVNIDAPHHDLLFFGNDAGNIVDNTNIIITDDAQGGGVLYLSFTAPFGPDDTITEPFTQFGCVGTVDAVDLDSSVDGDEAEDIIAIDGVATLGQLEINTLQVLVDDDHVITAICHLLIRMLIDKFVSTLHGQGRSRTVVMLLYFHISLFAILPSTIFL